MRLRPADHKPKAFRPGRTEAPQSVSTLGKVASFVRAHAGGTISRASAEAKLNVCNNCPGGHSFRRDGRLYCRSRRCGCGEWALSAEEHRSTLATNGCPEDYFPPGEWLPQTTPGVAGAPSLHK